MIEAFDQLKKRQIDLVITDVIMPGLSGVELLRKVIDSYPQTAVIIVSGVDRPQRALDAVRLGAFDYLIKPCDAEVLELTVNRTLGTQKPSDKRCQIQDRPRSPQRRTRSR